MPLLIYSPIFLFAVAMLHWFRSLHAASESPELLSLQCGSEKCTVNPLYDGLQNGRASVMNPFLAVSNDLVPVGSGIWHLSPDSAPSPGRRAA
jgi:hypothetical protein